MTRASEMIARLERAWSEAGLSAADRAILADRAETVMARRTDRFDDDHHPAFLHPLRTCLLLLEIGETDVRAHMEALELDTEVALDTEAALDPGVAPEAEEESVGEDRIERLLLADPPLRRAWLAERLDQIRHLRLWAGPDRTREALERADREERPLAEREGGRLAGAWRDWLDKAGRYRHADRAEDRPIHRG